MRWLGLLAVVAMSCGSARVGDTCRAHSDCGSLAEGYCARAEICTRECDEARSCPAGAACVSGGGRQVCLAVCTKDDECPKGFACDVGSAAPVCRLSNPLAPPPE